MLGPIQELAIALVSLTLPQLVGVIWSNRGVKQEVRVLRRDLRRDRRWSRRAFRRHDRRLTALESRPPEPPRPDLAASQTP